MCPTKVMYFPLKRSNELNLPPSFIADLSFAWVLRKFELATSSGSRKVESLKPPGLGSLYDNWIKRR